ncbi:MAG: MFS transporter [Jatrophihabitans sp.]|nr:MAG: MFS transporter [Jatrophihabitans sp.]
MPAPTRAAALTTVLAVLALTFLDTTIVSVALGNIQFDLGAGVIPLQWVVNGYSLVFASLMLVAGSLSDRFGRKWFMLGGIVVFCAGSVVCAAAPTIGWLIAGRAVMGVGAAASEPGTLSVIRHMYPDRATRARALGAWAAVSGLSLALGPVLGGLLVAAGSWRDVFWFNLALGAVLLVAAALYVPNSADPQTGRPDYLGFVSGAVLLGTVIYAVIAGEQYGYATPWIVLLFCIGAVALVLFAVVETRVRNPMLNFSYLKNSAVSSALFVAFAVYFGVFSIFFFTALYLDIVVGYSGWQMAGVFGPMAALIVAGSVGSGFWVGLIGPRGPMLAGCAISVVGIVLTRFVLTRTPDYSLLTIDLAVAGLGFGVAVVPLTAAVLGHVPAEHSGMAAGATNTARQLGSVVGVAALGALVNATLASDFGSDMARKGIAAPLRDAILNLLQTGGSGAAGIDIAHPDPSIKPLVDSATAAFRNGVHLSLWVSAALILVSALLLAAVPRRALDPTTEFD